jgi:hypothetical protein
MDEIVKITVWVPGIEAVNEILGTATVSVDCGAPRIESDGTFAVTLYASPAEAEKITALPYRHEADDTFGAVLAERQKEVSQTDRFEGGKVTPTGLGEKR